MPINFPFLISGPFAKIDSGDCESNGMRILANRKECEDAAVSLKVSTRFYREVKNEKLPPGCIYQSMHGFTFLLMNNHQESSVPCGKVQQLTFECICAAGKLLNFKVLKNQITKSSIKC